MVVYGESSIATPVKLGVPQGTLLGPIMFLIYKNDINENIRSPVRLFAGDCVIYKPITTLQDAEHLQEFYKYYLNGPSYGKMPTNVLY